MNFKALACIYLVISFSSMAYGAQRLHSDLNFRITNNILKSSDIHYSYGEFSNNEFSRESISSIDVENLSAQSKSRIFFAKSIFSINKGIDDVDTSMFFNTPVIQRIMGATSLNRVGGSNNQWNSVIPIYVINVKSHLEVVKVNLDSLKNDVYMDYFLAAEELDQNLPKSDYQVHIRLTKFNMGFDRMMVVCNFTSIPPKTAVSCYVIAKANNSWWKKRNFFNIASKKMKEIIKQVLVDTRVELLN